MRSFSITLALPLLVAACATPPGARRMEPRQVAVRNATGRDLFSVTLREAPRDARQVRRLGAVSPLLAGNVYSIRRGPDSKPLTDEVLVGWEQERGDLRSVLVPIRAAIQGATGAPDEALTFHLLPGGRVVVAVDPLDGAAAGRR